MNATVGNLTELDFQKNANDLIHIRSVSLMYTVSMPKYLASSDSDKFNTEAMTT